MEKVERRLRAFILLGIISAVATFMFISRSQPAAAAPLSAGDVLAELATDHVSLGLASAPAAGGVAAWWQRTSSAIKLQLTLSGQGRATAYLDRSSAELLRLNQNLSEGQIEKLLRRYAKNLSGAARSVAKGGASEAWSGSRRRFLGVAINQQALLGELASQAATQDSAARYWQARAEAWGTISSAVAHLEPDVLRADLAAAIPNEAAPTLRFAALLQEWRIVAGGELGTALANASAEALRRLGDLDQAKVPAIADRIRALSPNAEAQLAVASALELLQPTLVGLTSRFPAAAVGQGGTAQLPVEAPSAAPLSPAELAALQAELDAAASRDQILAVRQRWYSDDQLYARLRQHHRSLIDQLERKLQQALGQVSEGTTPPPPGPSGEPTPLPLQTLTPEQQAMAETYLRQLQGQYEDIPPPSTTN